MYPPHHLGGYELMWRSAVRQMRADGWEVRVLATDHRSPDAGDDGEEPDVHRELRWYWRDHAFPRMSLRARLALERANLATLERHIDEFEPDSVSWWAMGGMSLSLIEAVRRAGLPASGVVIDDWMLYGPRVDAWNRAMRGPLVGRLSESLTGVPGRVDLARAARWVFVSEFVRERALASGLALERTEVAHGGIDPALFRGPADDRAWDWRLLYLGRIDERKGIDTAIRALERLPEARLRVVGSGDRDHLERLGTLAAGLGVANRVEFATLTRDAVPAAYAEADAVLFPVKWDEPWGLVPLEAMAVGRPVVATGTGGSREYLRDGANCLLFEPRNDPAALAAAVQALAADPGLRARLRQGGLETASGFTEEGFNNAVMRALERARAETPAP
jgi:glycosyltransferase involved in cell wall biosynthesis